MCITDECVETMKETTEELFHEQRELIERLNAIQDRIQAESHPVRKVLLKVQWMEEKERSVGLLNKVQPPPHSFPPASPCAPCRTCCEAYNQQLTRPTSAQIVASLRGVLEEDAASGETAAANNKDSFASAPSHPMHFSKIFCDEKQATQAVDVDKLQLELLATFVAGLDQGYVRIAKPAARALREPPVSQRPRSRLGGTRSDEGGAPPGKPGAPPHSGRPILPVILPPVRTWSLPDVSRIVRERFPSNIQGDVYFYSWKIQRLSTSMMDWMVRGGSARIEGNQRNCA